MPLPPDLRFREATADDVPAIAAMRAAVGWTVHEWALEAVVRADDGRCIVAVDDRDEIQGVGSGMAYRPLGFVGNMIVSDAHRRRGVGSAILHEVTAFLEGRGCVRLELFATSEGRPLYARHGFEITGPSAMAPVPRSAPLDSAATVTMADAGAADEIAAYDAPRFGGWRSSLLAIMASDPERPLLVARGADDEVVGFGWVRPDAERMGPMVADSPAIAAGLLRAGFELLPGVEQLTLNLPLANRDGAEWLRGLGIELEPWDGRMARGPQVRRRDGTIYANTVGALG